MCVNAHAVKPWHGVCSVFALDDGFLILSIPVLKLSVELDGDDLDVAWVMVPGEVTVYTDYIHVGSLETKDERCNNITKSFTITDYLQPPTNQYLQATNYTLTDIPHSTGM